MNGINTRLEMKNNYNRNEFLSNRNIEDINLLNTENNSQFLDFALNTSQSINFENNQINHTPIVNKVENKYLPPDVTNDNFTIQQNKFDQLVNQKESELKELEQQQENYFKNEQKKYELKYDKLKKLEDILTKKTNKLVNNTKKLKIYEQELQKKKEQINLQFNENKLLIEKKKELIKQELKMKKERDIQLEKQDYQLKKLEEYQKNIELKKNLLSISKKTANSSIENIEQNIVEADISLSNLDEKVIIKKEKLDKEKLIQLLLVKLTPESKTICYNDINNLLSKYNIIYKDDLRNLNSLLEDIRKSPSITVNNSSDNINTISTNIESSDIIENEIETIKLEISSDKRDLNLFKKSNNFSIPLDKNFYTKQISSITIQSSLITYDTDINKNLLLEIPECNYKTELDYNQELNNKSRKIDTEHNIKLIPYKTLEKLTFNINDMNNEPVTINNVYFTLEIACVNNL